MRHRIYARAHTQRASCGLCQMQQRGGDMLMSVMRERLRWKGREAAADDEVRW